MPTSASLHGIDAALERLAHLGQSRRAAAQRSARAGHSLSRSAQKLLREVIAHAPVRISDRARATQMSDAA